VQGSAKNKAHIEQVVRALSVFVPGQNQERHQVIEWFAKEKLTDIECIKLVGIEQNSTSKGYASDTSETGSTTSNTSTLSRKWSQRLLKYLKKQGDSEEESDENQATITPKRVEEPTRSLAGLFDPPTRKSSLSSNDSLLSAASLEDVLNRAFRDQEFEDSDDERREVGPDGVSLIERRGRRYLQEKLNVFGDDQTIIVYLATQL
ncbi:hypothetical protein CU098_003833, partial [Rhizopus stolonifer]